MKITYLGHSCFCFETDDGLRLVTDPFTGVGYELPKDLTADIVLVSHGHFDHNYVQAVKGEPTVIDSLGEYDLKGVSIRGYDSWHDPKQGALRGHNILFHFTMDGITFCHFGDLGERCCKEVVNKLSGADVYLLPIGGTYTIDAVEAKEYMDKLSPALVIPMHYRPKDGALNIAESKPFLNQFDQDKIIKCFDGEYTLSKNDLQGLKGKILYMERR